MDERERQDELVVSALRSVGENCNSIFDFVNGPDIRNERSIDVLLGLLPIITDFVIKEGVVRALMVPNARGKVEKALVREFRNLPDDTSSQSLRWAIGNTLGSLNLKLIAEDVLEIASDKRFGFARQMIVHALNKLHDDRVVPLLIDLLDDESVRGHAIAALRKAKARSAITAIEIYASDKNPWIRRTAKVAIESLRKGIITEGK